MNKKRTGILILSLLSIFILLHGLVSYQCIAISAAEKGVSRYEVKTCKQFGAYNPPSSSKFPGLRELLVIHQTQGLLYLTMTPLSVLVLIEGYLTYKQKSDSKKKSDLES